MLEDQGVREGIKTFSDWPTIPQLYIDREFVGGCDIVKQMFNNGELHEMLGVEAPDRTPPEIRVSDAAAAVIANALQANPGNAVHLSIDGRWQHSFNLGPMEGHEVRAESNGVALLFDLASAQKAKGLSIDIEETVQGTAFRIDNPNAPPPVGRMSPAELAAARHEAGTAPTLVDVRTSQERARAVIEGSILLDDEGLRVVSALPKDTKLVFYCHTGVRSLGPRPSTSGHGRVHRRAQPRRRDRCVVPGGGPHRRAVLTAPGPGRRRRAGARRPFPGARASRPPRPEAENGQSAEGPNVAVSPAPALDGPSRVEWLRHMTRRSEGSRARCPVPVARGQCAALSAPRRTSGARPGLWIPARRGGVRRPARS